MRVIRRLPRRMNCAQGSVLRAADGTDYAGKRGERERDFCAAVFTMATRWFDIANGPRFFDGGYLGDGVVGWWLVMEWLKTDVYFRWSGYLWLKKKRAAKLVSFNARTLRADRYYEMTKSLASFARSLKPCRINDWYVATFRHRVRKAENKAREREVSTNANYAAVDKKRNNGVRGVSFIDCIGTRERELSCTSRLDDSGLSPSTFHFRANRWMIRFNIFQNWIFNCFYCVLKFVIKFYEYNKLFQIYINHFYIWNQL